MRDADGQNTGNYLERRCSNDGSTGDAKCGIIIGVDASNIRGGGGITHLSELLQAVRPKELGITRILVWGGRKTLEQLPSGLPWLELRHVQFLDRPLPLRIVWQTCKLANVARKSCDVLFIPGGSYVGGFRPFVTMSQNLLPFCAEERARYGLSWTHLRLRLLERAQKRTFLRADGVIFLTAFAKRVVESRVVPRPCRATIVPHGISKSFVRPPRLQRQLHEYSAREPFKWVYVSIVDVYKHQPEIAEAVAQLRAKGLPVAVDFIGPYYGSALARLRTVLDRHDPKQTFLRYRGQVAFDELPALYHSADAFVFASSCENMPNILIEAMASGLPIACAERGPMPEILGNGGIYFEPESSADIARALEIMMNDPDLRTRCARAAHQRSSQYSWDRCARDTFSFVKACSRDGRGGSTV